MSTKTSRSHSSPAAEEIIPFGEHVAELRSRLVWIVLAFLLASGLSLYFQEFLIEIVMSPLGAQKLVYLTPGGGFNFIFQITIYAGAFVAAPLLVFHLYRFLRPALPPRAQRSSVFVIVSSMILMITGVCFGYYVAIPSALAFLSSFAGDYITPNLTAESYISFVVAYLVGLGILFQLPLLLIMWNWVKPIKPGGLLSSQKYVIGFAVIAGAVITPTPDVVNQLTVAIPIIAIYQLGVISVYFLNRRARNVRHKT